MIKSFYEISENEYFQQLENKLRDEIHNESEDYILSLGENEYKSYLIDKYGLEKIEIFKSEEKFAEPHKKVGTIQDKFGRNIKRSIYHYTIKYPFSGDPSLFSVRPSQHSIEYKRIEVDTENNTVSINFKLPKNDQDQVEKEKEKIYSQAFVNLDSLNNSVERWNSLLPGKVDSIFDEIKKEETESKEPDEEAEITGEEEAESVPADQPAIDDQKEEAEQKEPSKETEVKGDEKAESVPAVAPAIEKSKPTPSVEKDEKVASGPHLSKELYTDILNIIYDVGKKMEKKPSLYLDRDEEDLRDQFMLFLETRYEGATGTSEIFSKKGSTDIILKYSEEGPNLFVAECKFWHGINVFKKVVSQLFGKYVTWKDSKAALLFFVTNQNFSSVLTEVKQHISEHPYYKNYLGDNGDSSFAYKFHLTNRDDIEIDLEVLLFHFPHLD